MAARKTLLILALVASTWFSPQGKGAAPPTATMGSTGLPEIVAIIGGSQITSAEIIDALGLDSGELDYRRYELIEKAVEKAARRRLLEIEAAARGLSAEELLEREVEAKLALPTGDEVREYWEANQKHLDPWGAEVEEQIRRYLVNQRRLRREAELLALLGSKYETRILLGPFRAAVAAGNSPSTGPPDAPVTLIVFSNFECSACRRLAPTLQRLAYIYAERVRMVFRQFPSTGSGVAFRAAEASLCAHEQGRFWPLHDALFEAETELAAEQLELLVSGLGLDMARFEQCFDSGRASAKVHEDVASGAAVGVVNPPVIFINGRILTGAAPYERISRVVEDELAITGS